MKPAKTPRLRPLEERLLVVDASAEAFHDAALASLPTLLLPGDLLVVNDAATLPASLRGTNDAGEPIELRLVRPLGDAAASATGETRWRAVAFGAGDWRARTEDRPAPRGLEPGTRLSFGELSAYVVAARNDGRLVDVVFHQSGAPFWSALYRIGEVIQYSYLTRKLALWDVQSAFASRPWAAEPPSAGVPLTWGVLLSAMRVGVELASVTHAAGLSSTGDASLDASLPWTEHFEIPPATVSAIAQAKANGGRVIAVGTTVVRALEGAAVRGPLSPGRGETNLVIGPGYRRRVVDALLTGMHEPTASHYALLQAFAPRALLERAYTHAEDAGYLGHEFGDLSLIAAR